MIWCVKMCLVDSHGERFRVAPRESRYRFVEGSRASRTCARTCEITHTEIAQTWYVVVSDFCFLQFALFLSVVFIIFARMRCLILAAVISFLFHAYARRCMNQSSTRCASLVSRRFVSFIAFSICLCMICIPRHCEHPHCRITT